MAENRNITTQQDQELEREQTRQGVVVTPPVDIYENKDELLVIADVPGTPADGVNLRFDSDQLFIEAAMEPVDEERTPLFREFGEVTYRRVFELAPGIDVDKISAELKHGVLRITLPKAEALKPRKIQVTAE